MLDFQSSPIHVPRPKVRIPGAGEAHCRMALQSADTDKRISGQPVGTEETAEWLKEAALMDLNVPSGCWQTTCLKRDSVCTAVGFCRRSYD